MQIDIGIDGYSKTAFYSNWIFYNLSINSVIVTLYFGKWTYLLREHL